MGSLSPFSDANAIAWSIIGIWCVGVTRLMLWHPLLCSSIIISASLSNVISLPSPRWLIVQFWQNMHLRLHWLKKIVPEPCLPTSGLSSPKCGFQLETKGLSPVLHTPRSPAVLSTLQFLGQRVQLFNISSASRTFSHNLSVDNFRYAGVKVIRLSCINLPNPYTKALPVPEQSASPSPVYQADSHTCGESV